MTNVARRSPSDLPRARSTVRDRVIAMLSAFALLAGLGLDVHATVMVHDTAHAAVSMDAQHDGVRVEHRGGHHVGARAGHPDASRAVQHAGQHHDGAPAGDDAPAGQSTSACCHAVCPGTVVPSDTGFCAELSPVADASLRLFESSRVAGLQHAPPLRPPR